MHRHRKYSLLDMVVQAVNECGWSILYVSDISQHPFALRIYNHDEGHLVRIYIWHLTHGGGVKRPKGEYRIQITGVDRFEQVPEGKTLILGWWEHAGIFAGFDYKRHNSELGLSPSIQIREDSLWKAQANGISTCDKGNREIAIAFRPDFFVEYVRNLEQLHAFGHVRKDLEILEQVADRHLDVNEEVLSRVSRPRRTTVLTISKRLRDTAFKTRVLAAYHHQCAICGLQLKLVDAAHILPVAQEGSTDETRNGVCLCTLHHRAYDVGLVTFDQRYRVYHNQTKMTLLENIGHDGGMQEFIGNLRKDIYLPQVVNEKPHKNYVLKANEFRGWNFPAG